MCKGICPSFPKKNCTAIFDGHLEFLRKMQNTFISETVQEEAILDAQLARRVSAKPSPSIFFFINVNMGY